MPTMDEYVADRLRYDDPIVTPTGTPGTLSIELIESMYAVLLSDRENHFDQAFDYYMGDHLLPYAPQDASDQIVDLQQRSITNWMPLLVNLPVQVSYVDGYRRGSYGLGSAQTAGPTAEEMAAGKDPKRFSPEYACWQRNRMDARQSTIYRAALKYGQSFAFADNSGKDVKIKILPTRHTVAFFEDPVNDIRPKIVLSIKSYAQDDETPGLAYVLDDLNYYELNVHKDGSFSLITDTTRAHGLSGCPVVRYTCGAPDDEGRSLGVINDTMVALQNRVNQSAFSTNVTADFGAFKVRTAAGLQVMYRIDPETGEPLIDASTGQPIPVPIKVSQAKMLISDDPATKFDQLDETPLDGYLKAEDQATKHLAAIAQFPLHALMGNVSNLSAEALNALETQFMRHLHALQTSWGESHEELFRLIAEALDDSAGANAFGGEVRWRDMSSKAFGATLDGLGKAAEMLGMPKRGLWAMVPGMTSGDLQDFEKLHDAELTDAILNQTDPASSALRERRPARPQSAKNADAA